ncbi:MAG: hypothetical protein ACE3L7_05150 [Candidatus Pristimantibacillus sp.]
MDKMFTAKLLELSCKNEKIALLELYRLDRYRFVECAVWLRDRGLIFTHANNFAGDDSDLAAPSEMKGSKKGRYWLQKIKTL